MSNKNVTFLVFFFILSLISSCSEMVERNPPLKALSAAPSWFKTQKRFTHYDYKLPESRFLNHPFFDLSHYLTKKDQGVNIVIMTRKDSPYEYRLDMKSGRPYMKRRYCKENDVWESYSGYIDTPPYSTGFVPRILDQRGLPQKVITFGDLKYFPKADPKFSSSVRVRIVGGVIEQYCPKYPCTVKNKWLSRIVLVAVNPNDPKFENTVHMDQLKEIVDWSYIRSFLENGNGRNVSALKALPNHRIIGGFGSNEVIDKLRKKGHIFSEKEIRSLKKNCYSLYDFLWNWTKTMRKNQTLASEGGEQDLMDTSHEEFSNFMLTVSKKYKKRFMLCQKYVRAGSINDDFERLWFFSYLNAFYSVESLGEVYSCKHRSWIKNPYLITGRRVYDPLRELEYCSTDDLNLAFYKVITSLGARQGSFQPYYRFVTYDNSRGGTHEKLYSWIFEDSGHQSCVVDKNEGKGIVLPTNIEWKAF